MPKYSDKPCARCGKMMLHAYCSQRYCKACAPLVRSDDAIINRAKQRSKRAMSEIARVERAAAWSAPPAPKARPMAAM